MINPIKVTDCTSNTAWYKPSRLKFLILVAIITLLNACSTVDEPKLRTSPFKDGQQPVALDSTQINNDMLLSIEEGIQSIQSGNYKEASTIFQRGLKLDPRNSQLHFLNGLNYHLQSLSGDSAHIGLAETGYLMALKYDPGDYWASYFLGQIYYHQQRYVDAQNQFSYGLLYAPENPQLLHSLAVVSYYQGQPGLGVWAAQKAIQADSSHLDNLRALYFNYAASGQMEKARFTYNQYKVQFASYESDQADSHQTDSALKPQSARLDDWELFHKQQLLAQNSVFSTKPHAEVDIIQEDIEETNTSSNYNATADLSNSATSKPSVTSSVTTTANSYPKMALVDVVILRTEESQTQSRGINLLEGLQATLSGTLYGRTKMQGTDAGSDVSQNVTTSFSPTFSLAGLNYNLNIFNDGVNKAEVLARPSLLATDGQMSQFYSGAILHVQLSSNSADGSLVDLPIGLHLDVTPEFYDNDTLKITVHAKRDFIETNSEHVGFTAFSQTSSTSVSATAVLKFGETLILSGLSEFENDYSKNGVPFLKSIPIIQYFFSTNVELQTKKSVIILLTPHKAQIVDNEFSGKEHPVSHDHHNPSFTDELIQSKSLKHTHNVDAAFLNLSGGQLFKEFRRGDLFMSRWYNSDTLGKAFGRTLDFLYY
ncbi:MAG: hypothetical protein GY820_47970 [Gammaproteobacteria bacterium]|nr:hypothetical protein [Gammaproteobacteria bacterium]